MMGNTLEILNGDNAWEGGNAKEITFIVTKDCQLACKYCYLVGKNTHERMTWDIAKRTIDYILNNEFDENFNHKSVVWDFIGGEPFLEIDLIDKICDYIKIELYSRNHHWFNSYRFNFSTNGINYHTEKVQNFIKKNLEHLSIGVTIDGNELLHDLNRIYKDSGKGSYKDVVKNIPLWLSQWKNRARETLYSVCLLTLLDTKKRATKVAIKLTPARAILTGDFFRSFGFRPGRRGN